MWTNERLRRDGTEAHLPSTCFCAFTRRPYCTKTWKVLSYLRAKACFATNMTWLKGLGTFGSSNVGSVATYWRRSRPLRINGVLIAHIDIHVFACFTKLKSYGLRIKSFYTKVCPCHYLQTCCCFLLPMQVNTFAFREMSNVAFPFSLLPLLSPLILHPHTAAFVSWIWALTIPRSLHHHGIMWGLRPAIRTCFGLYFPLLRRMFANK